MHEPTYALLFWSNAQVLQTNSQKHVSFTLDFKSAFHKYLTS